MYSFLLLVRILSLIFLLIQTQKTILAVLEWLTKGFLAVYYTHINSSLVDWFFWCRTQHPITGAENWKMGVWGRLMSSLSSGGNCSSRQRFCNCFCWAFPWNESWLFRVAVSLRRWKEGFHGLAGWPSCPKVRVGRGAEASLTFPLGISAFFWEWILMGCLPGESRISEQVWHKKRWCQSLGSLEGAGSGLVPVSLCSATPGAAAILGGRSQKEYGRKRLKKKEREKS